jgi:hypothetical protein
VVAMVAGLAATAFVCAPPAQASVQTDITYQGELGKAGDPFNGQANMTFRLYATALGGSPLQIVAPPGPITVTNGRFTMQLAFDQNLFAGAERWLEITVEEVGVAGIFTLSPRQPITSSPYSLYAMNAYGPGITGINASNIATGTVADAYLSTNVAMRNAVNTFAAANTFTQALTLATQGTATTHAVRADRSIATAGGLTGGGNLTANRTLTIADAGVTGSKLADGSVSAAKIADGSVTTTKLADGSVSTAKIVDLGVSATKLANSSVTTTKIADGSVTNPKIASLDWAKIFNAPAFLTVEADPTWTGPANATGDISRTGRIGIGTSTPTHLLTVHAPTIDALRLIGPGAFGSGARFTFGDADYVRIEEDMDDALRIHSSYTRITGGNVGIGTLSPQTDLHVEGTTRLTTLAGTGTRMVRTSAAGDLQPLNSGTTAQYLRGDGVWAAPTLTESDPTWSGAANTTGSISRTGNVGIGTASPTAPLHVEGFASEALRVVNPSTSGWRDGILAQTSSSDGYGLWAQNLASSGAGHAGSFHTASPDGYAVYASGGRSYFAGRVGVGLTAPDNPLHVTSPAGNSSSTIYADHPNTGDQPAIWGSNVNRDGYGVGLRGTGAWVGVEGVANSGGGTASTWARTGVSGFSSIPDVTNYGVVGQVWDGSWRYGVYGSASSTATNSWAGYFAGRAHVTSTLSKGAGTFKIDHPLDPENKYLYHSFVESPDMMNIYNGNVITDHNGYATITMPDWFDALNRDFRYQLTVVDESDDFNFILVKVVRRMQDGQFSIRTSHPHTEVSWQVTGIRQDAFAEANRIQVEVDKSPEDRGLYLHPEAFGQPAEKGIDWRHTPEAQEQQRAALSASE